MGGGVLSLRGALATKQSIERRLDCFAALAMALNFTKMVAVSMQIVNLSD
jgi:hypothetical protein